MHIHVYELLINYIPYNNYYKNYVVFKIFLQKLQNIYYYKILNYSFNQSSFLSIYKTIYNVLYSNFVQPILYSKRLYLNLVFSKL